MTNEQDFKVGDKVAITTDKNRIVGTITNVGRKYYNITLDNGRKTMTAKENVEPYDRRTDFLRRLGALLREFDASFEFYDVYDMEIRIGEESVKYGFLNKENSPSLTADNIMEFDKE